MALPHSRSIALTAVAGWAAVTATAVFSHLWIEAPLVKRLRRRPPAEFAATEGQGAPPVDRPTTELAASARRGNPIA